jgi:anti-sigma factor RsiW
MTCRELAEFILDYTTGELPDKARAVFEQHLSRCDNCHEYLAQYKVTVEAERRALAPAPALPADVPEELIRAILQARKSQID